MFPVTLAGGRWASAAVALMAFALGPVQAQESPAFRFDGFGTLGVVHSDEERADFVSSLLVPDGAGYSSEWSAEVDSRLGLQLSVELSPRISAVVQVIAEQQYDGSYDPAIEWANVSIDLGRELELRVGRMVLPTFMISEYRKVGYANTASRPAPEVYQLVPVTSIDGLNLTYRTRFSDATNTLQVLYGSKDVKSVADGFILDVESAHGWSLANTLERGSTTLFASYTNIPLTIDTFDPLFESFRAFGPAGEAIADHYDIDDKQFEIMTLGARYDPGDWFVLGEWARSRSRSLAGDSRGWYLMGGYRIGAFTPFLTLADRRVSSETSHPGIPVPQAQPLNEFLNRLLNDAPRQKRAAAGVRWDFARSFALKVQLDYIDLGSDSEGVLKNTQPGFERGGDVSLFSTTLDFVF